MRCRASSSQSSTAAPTTSAGSSSRPNSLPDPAAMVSWVVGAEVTSRLAALQERSERRCRAARAARLPLPAAGSERTAGRRARASTIRCRLRSRGHHSQRSALLAPAWRALRRAPPDCLANFLVASPVRCPSGCSVRRRRAELLRAQRLRDHAQQHDVRRSRSMTVRSRNCTSSISAPSPPRRAAATTFASSRRSSSDRVRQPADRRGLGGHGFPGDAVESLKVHPDVVSQTVRMLLDIAAYRWQVCWSGAQRWSCVYT
jgi:hypothetical protein